MKGVWDYLHGDTQTPKPLTIGFWCERYQRPIVDGGYDDQPVKRTMLMNMALNYYHAIDGYMKASKKMKGKEWITWTKENTQAVEIFNQAAKVANGTL